MNGSEMNLELKNVKIHEDMSDETLCFSATIYLNGKKAGTVENRGCGGCNFYHWVDRKAGQRINEWAATQPTEFDFEKLDQIIDGLLGRWEVLQWLKRNSRRTTLFRLKDDDHGAWRTIQAPYSQKVKEHLVKKYGKEIECIANENLDAAVPFCQE